MPRGAGGVFAAMLPPGSAFISLFPTGRWKIASKAGDNYPWWPLPLVRRDLAIRAVPCVSRAPVNATSHEMGNCYSRSVNFCDMHCAPSTASDALRSVHAEIIAGTLTWQLPDLSCPSGGNTRCSYAALENEDSPQPAVVN
jgi:hypothetical protein